MPSEHNLASLAPSGLQAVGYKSGQCSEFIENASYMPSTVHEVQQADVLIRSVSARARIADAWAYYRGVEWARECIDRAAATRQRYEKGWLAIDLFSGSSGEGHQWVVSLPFLGPHR